LNGCPDCTGGGQSLVSIEPLSPVFKRKFPAPLVADERDVDLMGEAELRVLVKKLLAERR
jgi:hypothetical protein